MKWKMSALACALIACNLVARIDAKGLNRGSSMVVSAGEVKHRQKRSVESSMTSMHIKSVIKSRLAKVTTTTTMQNSASEAKEMTFSVRLAKNAYISKFTMDVAGVLFVGKVKPKQLAQEEYEGARERGSSAGLVTANVRETETFNVAANVPARSRVTFNLEYQELLVRRLGKYEQIFFINPEQIVEDLAVNVYITEDTGISTLEAHHPQGHEGNFLLTGGYDRSGEVGVDVQIKRSKHQALISFKPTPAQVRRLLMIPENERKVSVVYDVTREELGGELLIRDGYFVHFFAPENLPVLPKRVVFVIDRSGSMMGRKMDQTKKAFATVLRDLSPIDKFNIITFASSEDVWRRNTMVEATEHNKNAAIAHVNRIRPSGATNFNGALLRSVRLLNTLQQSNEVLSAIIALTDGEPTTGVTNEDAIRRNVKNAIDGAHSLFCIGFGDNLHHDFLTKLATENNGIERKIYSDSDADIQLVGFFQEVAVPLLLNVRIQYDGDVADVRKPKADKYFSGSEFVVVGRKLGQVLLEARITGHNDGGDVEYEATGREISDFSHSEDDPGQFTDVIERLWAHLTFKRLLEDKVLAETREEKERLTTRATNLAMKYGFVTPFTSMVVVLPQDEITTPAAATTDTPIPVCLRRGQVGAGVSSRRLIWCPYIFDGVARQHRSEERVQNHGPTARIGGARLSSRMFMQPRSRLAYSRRLHSGRTSFYYGGGVPRLSSSRIAKPRTSAVLSARAGSRIRARIGMSYDYGYDYFHPPMPTRPPAPQVSDHCGGTLRSSRGDIILPSNLRLHHTSTVYCDWKISLPAGSWIDLNVNNISTTSAKVEITSHGEKIVSHNGGRLSNKYFSIMSKVAKVRVTVNPSESSTEIVQISYSEFNPVTVESDERSTDGGSNIPTCGSPITIDQGLSGNISSPNYPSYYLPNTFCSWSFAVNDPETQRLSLQILDMDIETDGEGNCVKDTVTFTQGSETGEPYCGIKRNEVIDVESDSVVVEFRSDGDFQGPGFQLHYAFIER